MTGITLEAVTKTFTRGRVVDSIHLQIEDGEFFTILGPSGSGKSTTLRLIAGFEEPTSGRIYFDGRDVTYEPPNRREIGFVFQSYALFPHMSVFDNVAFGLQVRKTPRTELIDRVVAALQKVRLGDLSTERIDRLSGGQQQRVALARALIIRPRLLLLDEPLSNLDARLREETRANLRVLHSSSGVTTICVTHDQVEAMGVSDRMAVLHEGKIQQIGAPEEIYERPASRFVADFVGCNNVLDATVRSASEHSAVVQFGDGSELTVDTRRRAAGVHVSPGARVGVCLRADSFRLAGDTGSFTGILTDVEYAGSVRSCVISTGVGNLRVDLPSSAGRVSPGEVVRLAVVESATHLLEAI